MKVKRGTQRRSWNCFTLIILTEVYSKYVEYRDVVQ